ncbi:unnamed protein product [Rodentolepis nana]|uniref:Secreted protein n=1 Tax=Rodentolepis nana TaxID=102285 RepID=A0A0R3U087_RODNA|nr:unnamed protein product [Rodentolepis nana]
MKPTISFVSLVSSVSIKLGLWYFHLDSRDDGSPFPRGTSGEVKTGNCSSKFDLSVANRSYTRVMEAIGWQQAALAR